MDGAIVRWLNGGVGRFRLLDEVMEAMVSDYLVPVLASLVLVGLWFCGNDRTRFANQVTTLVGITSLGIASAVTAVINSQVSRPRPFLDNDLTLLFYEPTDSSFPSNIASVGFALATAVFLRHRKLGAMLYLFAFLWGFARVYAGVHYPSDILVGAAIGVVAAMVIAVVYRVLEFVPRHVLRVARMLYLA